MASRPFLHIAALKDMDPADAHMLVAVTPGAYRQGEERAGLNGLGKVFDTISNAAQRALTDVYPDLRPEHIHVRRLEQDADWVDLEIEVGDLLEDGGRQVTQVLVLDGGDWPLDTHGMMYLDFHRALAMVPNVPLDYSSQSDLSFEEYLALRLKQRGAGVFFRYRDRLGHRDDYKVPGREGVMDGRRNWLPHSPHWLLSVGTHVDYLLGPEQLAEEGIEFPNVEEWARWGVIMERGAVVPSAKELKRWRVTMEQFKSLGGQPMRLVLKPGVPIQRQYDPEPYGHMIARFAGFQIIGGDRSRVGRPFRLLRDLTLAQCDIRTGWHLDGTERAKELLDAKA